MGRHVPPAIETFVSVPKQSPFAFSRTIVALLTVRNLLVMSFSIIFLLTLGPNSEVSVSFR